MLLLFCFLLVFSKQYNVLFIVTDDLAPVFHEGASYSPNFDWLAERSVKFSRAYVSVAVCSPSRTAFLTGLRPDQTQVWTIDPYFRRKSHGQGQRVVTLPQLFRQAGYFTAGSGKIFHAGSSSGGVSSSEGGGDMCPEDLDGICKSLNPTGSWSVPYWFCDQYYNDTAQSPSAQEWPCSKKTWPSCGIGCAQTDKCKKCFEDAGSWGSNKYTWFGANCPDDCYPEGMITENAMSDLSSLAKGGPFFYAVGYKRPHLAWKAPENYFSMYSLDDITLPEYPSFPVSAPNLSYAHPGEILGKPDTSAYIKETCKNGVCRELVVNDTTVREMKRAYYASATFVDAQLGRLLSHVDDLGLFENTVVIFLGDHGYQLGENQQWTKSNNFERSLRIPLLIAVPGKNSRKNVTESQIVESIDLYPTLADLAGISLPEGQQLNGESLVGLLSHQGHPLRERKNWALSQWPRRPSCIQVHKCIDGHNDPSAFLPDQAVMGYSLRVENWRYGAWFPFDYNSTKPQVDLLLGNELYDHSGAGSEATNLAGDGKYAKIVVDLHKQLVQAIANGGGPPFSNI